MITLIALVRVIPYILVAIYAWRKGYKWLTIAGVYVSLLAINNFFNRLSPEGVGITASVFALLLFFHALDLKDKRSK